MIFNLAGIIALISVLTALVRFIKGPTVADRTVSLDVMTIIAIAVIAFISLLSGRIIYLDVALVYALISFIGVVAIARYIEGGM